METRRLAIQERNNAAKKDIGKSNTDEVNEAKGPVQEEKPDAVNETNHAGDNLITKPQNLQRRKRGSNIENIGKFLGSYDDVIP